MLSLCASLLSAPFINFSSCSVLRLSNARIISFNGLNSSWTPVEKKTIFHDFGNLGASQCVYHMGRHCRLIFVDCFFWIVFYGIFVSWVRRPWRPLLLWARDQYLTTVAVRLCWRRRSGESLPFGDRAVGQSWGNPSNTYSDDDVDCHISVCEFPLSLPVSVQVNVFVAVTISVVPVLTVLGRVWSVYVGTRTRLDCQLPSETCFSIGSDIAVTLSWTLDVFLVHFCQIDIRVNSPIWLHPFTTMGCLR